MTDTTIPCRGCGRAYRATARFCDECGAARHHVGGNTISTGRGDITSRDVYQAGRDIHLGQAGEEPAGVAAPAWETKPLWNSPVTQGMLAWASFGLGVLGIIAGWQSIAATLRPLLGERAGELVDARTVGWTFAFLGIGVLFAIVFALFRVARGRTLALSRFAALPGVVGWGGRIGIVRLIGRCRCGGRLRFYDRGAGKKGNFARDMVAECRRVPERHQWWIDPSSTDPT